MRNKGIFSLNSLDFKENFGQQWSNHDHFCIKKGKISMMKKPQSKFSKTAGKTATRRTPKKTAEAYEKPQGFAVFPQGGQHCLTVSHENDCNETEKQ